MLGRLHRSFKFFRIFLLFVLAFGFAGEVVGQATLPVGTTNLNKSSLPTGFSHFGLGNNYSGPKLKFDDDGDFLILFFNSPAGNLTFDVGINNDFSTTIPAGATFQIFESSDGSTYTSLASYSNVPTGTKTVTGISASTQYLKWEYTIKPSGSNIALYNINLGVQVSNVDNPDAFTATASSTSQIDLAATANTDGDTILVAWNSSNTFGTPLSSTTYIVGSDVEGDGTVLYYGPVAGLIDHTGLTAATQYFYKIWSFDGTDYSAGLTDDATTLCDAFTLPFFEGFEGGVVPPSCWIAFENGDGVDLTRNWEVDNGSSNSGTYSATVSWEDFGSGLSSDWLVTPLIDLSTSSNSYLSFFEDDYNPADYGSNFYIKVSTASQNDPADFTDNIAVYGEVDFGSAFQQRTIDLSAYDGQQIYIAFVMEQNDGDGWSIDDVVIDQVIIKPEPTNHATNISCATNGYTQIDLSWDDAIGVEIPDGYLVLWSDVDFASIPIPADGTYTPDGANARNVLPGVELHAITGLSQNTDYFFKIYPYTNSGAYVDYKTDIPVPETGCVTDIGPCGFESFTNIPTNSSTSYSERNWTGDNSEEWTATDARTDGTLNSAKAITLRTGSLSNDLPISGGAGLLSFDFARVFSGNSVLKVFVNGVQYGGDVTVSNTSSTTFSTVVNVGGPISVEIENSGNRTAINNLSWICYDDCTPTQTISDFYPIEGPPETLVTIVGTGFTGSSDVEFGGISAASFSVEHDTLIIATVPVTGLSGKIAVSISGCARKSADDFTILDKNESCGGGGGETSYATDLFISEVYDSNGGSLSYVEIFNGTASSVALSIYSILIDTGADVYHPMSGNLASGDTYILRIGSGSSTCPDFSVDDDKPSAPGFNENDDISLLKNGTTIDIVTTPNQTGYSISRHDDVFEPSDTFISSEWTVSNSENCNDLGVAPYNPNSNQIIINSQPVDVDCDELTFTVDAENADDQTEPSTYTWRYVAPGDTTWSLVSSLNGTNGLTVTGANTATISITGNTSDLKDYQFYVDMGSGGTGECRRFSNAAHYSFESKAFYRTLTSGDWSDRTIWEMSETEGGPYTSPVCQYPVDQTSEKVIIEDGFDVNLDIDLAIDWLVIEESGSLTLAENAKLTVNDGNPLGADLELYGTLIDNGNTLNGIDFFNDISTWEMGTDGTLIKSNTSGSGRYRDAYEGGISFIPSTSTWIYRYTGIGNISFANSTIGVPMYYPNLILENATVGTYSSNINTSDINLSTFTMTGSQPMTIKGNFDVGGAGTGNVNFTNINSGSSPILVEGELTVKAGSTLRNTGTDAPSQGVGFEVKLGMNIEGTLDLSAGSGANVGILKLSGADDMLVYGPSVPPLITVKSNHLIIDLAVDKQIYTDLNFEIDESATFTQGILEFAEPDNLITFNSGASVSNASNASFVHGKVIKIRAANEEFTFPIGDVKDGTNPWYQPVRIFDVSGAATVEAEYFANENANAGAYYDGQSNTPGDNQDIGNCDYWLVNKVSGSDVRLGFAYTNVDTEYCNDVTNNNFLSLVRWNSLAWDPPVSGVDPTSVAGEISSGGPIQGYGEFVLSTTSSDFNVLPITLLSFTAIAKEDQVITSWITASELNNDFFTVERSADAQVFKSIGDVEGAGTSHGLRSYSFSDDAPLSGISYYRLMQTDYDGTTTYSEIRSVEYYNSGNFSLDMAYRSDEGMSLAFTSTAPYLTVEIFDVFGKRVYGGLVENYGGRAIIQPTFKRGVYVVRLSQGDKSDSRKVFW